LDPITYTVKYNEITYNKITYNTIKYNTINKIQYNPYPSPHLSSALLYSNLLFMISLIHVYTVIVIATTQERKAIVILSLFGVLCKIASYSH